MIKIKRIFYFVAITMLLSGCITIPTGDGGKIKLGKDGIQIEGEDGEKATIDVDTDEGGYSITTEGEEEGKDSTINIGSKATVPNTFPKDIPVPSDEFLFMVSETDKDESDEHDRNSISLAYQVEGDFKESYKKYEEFLKKNGYETESYNLAETMLTLMGTKGETLLSIGIVSDEENKYMLQIMYFFD